MKKTILLLAALFFLAACQPKGNGNYNPNDARTFGLSGDVKTVMLSSALKSVDGEAVEEDDAWLGVDELALAFDEAGRVLKDAYGDPYEYDEAGNFVRGYNDKTTMTRDEKGRLTEYDNATLDYEDDFDYEDLNIEEVFRVGYTYDAQGRAAEVEMSGWEWMSTEHYVYEGKNVYPASYTFETFEEGYVEDGTVTYAYTEFDSKGNWIERTVTTNSRLYEEDLEEEAENSSRVIVERRAITYWSDAE